ncbi:retropepsin-like aspartic protease [Methylomonas sp. EFPC3]|uniref:retropepsin-like aspartic protease family protein n=1 Tax=Methylomonas sp. EFPC3 TaxID=3021710 RepID=UPI002416FA3C|nr:retropepsin-like aspartic protease [Methylomonas sp. EFPC3]WFP50518.1 retropepsin-like aspartic protease [Methylomonas sp. EFPC3]
MGFEDRDYYREQLRKRASRPLDGEPRQQTVASGRHSSAGTLRYLLMPLAALAGLWYGADALLAKQAAARHPLPEIVLPATADGEVGGIGAVRIKADSQGHFRGTLLINNVPMPFMIDTGATKTSIPEKYARAAGLPVGGAVQAETAGGRVTDYQTRIASLKLGNLELRDLDAHINRYLDEVLVGMNTLKYFRIEQSGDSLVLVAEAS